MKTAIVGIIALAGLASMAQADLKLALLKQIDVSGAVAPTSADRIGTNVSAVAWNGSKLYIAGQYNGGSGTLPTGIMEISDPLGTPALGTRFGTQTTNFSRGYTGLTILGNRLGAGWDNGAAAAGGYTTWNTSSNTSVASATLRGFTGPAFDPGFNGTGSTAGNLGYGATGAGRRGVMNTETGSLIFTTANGMIFNNNPPGATPAPGTNNRDIAFDPATGDIYGRAANAVIKGVRTADNAISGNNGTVIYSNYGTLGQSTASNTNGQNLAFVDLAGFGNYILFNDRPVSQSGAFTSVVKAIDTSGVIQTIDFSGFGITSSTSVFDFSWDAASKTLAVADYSNSNVYIFSVIPSPGSLAFVGVGGLLASRRRRS